VSLKEIPPARSFLDPPEEAREELPDWYKSSRSDAWMSFQDIDWPKRSDEAWRFANLKKLSYENLYDAKESESNDVEQLVASSLSLKENAGQILFVNDRVIASPLLNEEFSKKGVIFQPLSQALIEHGELVQDHFMTEASRLGSAKYAALHRARLRNGFFFYVPEGVSLTVPVEVFHWVSGNSASIFPHSLIVAGPGSSATVAEYVTSIDDEISFCCAVCDIHGEEDSQLTYLRTQNLSEKAQSIYQLSSRAASKAKLKTFNLDLGCEWVRNESVSRLVGEGATSEMLAVSVPEKSQEFDMRTLQLHEQRNTSSNLLYKNALYDDSKTTFAGMIVVEDEAHQTDAYQTCRNLLMSDTSEANSMPGLEIKADQVRCSHGATCTPVSKDELFYLQSRGVKEPAARQLLTFGFVKEAVDRIGNNSLEEVILGKLGRRFNRIGAG
jgi:Fe-S cluster assembly protein SufD